MVRGECEAAVAVAARADRIDLAKMPAAPWLNTRGHFRLPARAQEAIPIMQRAFEMLAGDPEAMRSKRLSALPNDLVHLASRTMIEVDESQHFTSMRGVTLDLVDTSEVGYDVEDYRTLVSTWRSRSDRYFAAKTTVGFPGPLSRGRGRAYFDLLRDVVGPLMGYQVIRVPAVDVSPTDSAKGAAAYLRARSRIAEAIGNPEGPAPI